MAIDPTPIDLSLRKIFYITGLLLFLILCRLFFLQIYASHEFFTRAQRNYTRTITIQPQRGNILDCKGNLLATNRPMINLFWQGSGNRNFSQSQLELLDLLDQTIEDFSAESKLDALKFAERTKRKTIIKKDIPLEHLSKISEKFPNSPNVFIENEMKRFYPHKQLASHILGYISSMNSPDSSGKMGLERILESSLGGHEGQLVKMINSVGAHLYQEEIQKSLSGQNIKTTLDLSLQQIAEDCFDEQLTGALIALDPRTGAIKSLISRPTFDPSLFLEPISHNDWFNLQQQRPFLNRAFNAAYPPASLFKLVTLSAALELDIIDETTTMECKGFIRFGGRRYHCARRWGHGELSVAEWIAKSCNIPFYEIGKRISIDDLAEFAKRFGLGQKTNVIFNEQKGLVPTKLWKMENKGERWWPGETLSATIGQSYYLTSPIQIARMIASIFTGYLITPRILEDEPIQQRPLGMKASTLKILKRSLKSVVTKGTGANLSKIQDIKVHAKTGTAQIISLNKRSNNDQLRAHAWFIGHFRYKKEEPLVLVILVEHAGSSRIATSIAKQFLVKYRSLMEKISIA